MRHRTRNVPMSSIPGDSAGFSLVELIVGMLISLICVLGMMACFAAFEAQKRTTTAASDAHQNGSFAAVALTREIRSAGSALVQGKNYGVWGCAITAWSANTRRLPLTSPLAEPFDNWPATTVAAPVLVASGGATGPDVIGVIRGNPSQRTFKSNVLSTTTNEVIVDSAFGFLPGDYLLASDNSGACAVGRAEAVTIGFDSGTLTLTPADSPTNGFKDVSSGVAYLMDLGSNPVISLYGVDTRTSSLVVYDLLQRTAAAGVAVPATAVADSVVNMKTLYGVDDGANGGQLGDGSIDEWVQPRGATWGIGALSPVPNTAAVDEIRRQILAVRVAIVVRSRQLERAAPAMAASVQGVAHIGYTGTGSLILFKDQATALQYTIPTLPHYRYQLYDMIIPVRNNYTKKYF